MVVGLVDILVTVVHMRMDFAVGLLLYVYVLHHPARMAVVVVAAAAVAAAVQEESIVDVAA